MGITPFSGENGLNAALGNLLNNSRKRIIDIIITFRITAFCICVSCEISAGYEILTSLTNREDGDLCLKSNRRIS